MWKNIIFGVFLGVGLACVAIAIEQSQLDEIIRPLTHNNDMGGMGVMLLFYIGVLVQPALGIILGIAIPMALHKTHELQSNVRTVPTQVTARVGGLTLSEPTKTDQEATPPSNEEEIP